VYLSNLLRVSQSDQVASGGMKRRRAEEQGRERDADDEACMEADKFGGCRLHLHRPG